jgi:IclR family acetate operon transcriptional repressor
MLAFGGGGLPRGPLHAYTRRTIVDPDALAAEVERVRERGWADAIREREDDLAAVAAPVLGAGGALAAIVGLQGPASRFGRAAIRAAVAPLLREAAAIGVAVGGGVR